MGKGRWVGANISQEGGGGRGRWMDGGAAGEVPGEPGRSVKS